MYRSSPEVKKPTEPFKNFLGLNGLDMKCYQDMYLENCASLDSGGSTSSPSISPSSSISTTTSGTESISPDFMSSPNTTIMPSSSLGGGMMNTVRGNHTDIQKQQFFAVHQQHQLAAPTVVQNQFAMATDAGSNYPANYGAYTQQQQDEISKSLKMFAMLSGYPNENEPIPSMPPQMPQSPVDEVMQDFACNGYACDELNRYQLGMHLSNNPALTPTGLNTSPFHSAKTRRQNAANVVVVTSPSAADGTTAALQELQQLQKKNLNNNFWKALPPHKQQQQQNTQTINAATTATDTATAAAVTNTDYNSTQKKPRRYHSSKEKYATKHCVFCENNNEAEAVVKSHSVRDSLGRVLCPKLRTYICPICKASGDMAHTVKYCPKKPIITMEDALKGESFRLTKGTYYKQQMKV